MLGWLAPILNLLEMGAGVVSTSAPVANFIAMPTAGVAPRAISFTDLSTGTVTSESFDPGDGSPIQPTVPSVYIYRDSGTFSPSLTVNGPDGSNTLVRTGYIHIYSRPGPPPDPTPPESRAFAKIAQAIRPRLASYCGIAEDFVYPVANDNYDVTIDEDFFLYFQFFGIETFGDTGGGRLNPWTYRRMRVYVYTRAGTDPYGTDEVALQGEDVTPTLDPASPLPLGQFKAEELVMGALFNWMPLDSNGVALCLEPIHPFEGSGPPLRKAENSAGLLRTHLDFQIKYGLNIDRRDPPI